MDCGDTEVTSKVGMRRRRRIGMAPVWLWMVREMRMMIAAVEMVVDGVVGNEDSHKVDGGVVGMVEEEENATVSKSSWA